MTSREALHQIGDQLPDDQADLARMWLEDLRDAADADGPPLDAATLASLDRGLADVAEEDAEGLWLRPSKNSRIMSSGNGPPISQANEAE